MLNQEVGVDVWKMVKAMGTYAALSLAGWIVLRLFTSILTMPQRLRNQQERIQQSLQEFQRRYPDMKFTEEELKDAQREIEEDQRKREEEANETSANPEEKKSK